MTADPRGEGRTTVIKLSTRVAQTLRVAAIPAAGITIITIYTMRWQTGLWLLSLYGLLATSRVIAQVALAKRCWTRMQKDRWSTMPMVSIVIAVYNEPAHVLTRTLRSLAEQSWPRYEVIVVDDGSDDPDTCRNLCTHYGYTYVYQRNAGKRHAMRRAFDLTHPDSRYILTGDSDTHWHPNAIADLVAAMQSNPRAGAATGYVAAANPDTNTLTRLTAQRYWTAFQIERASEGYLGVLSCVSGPLGIYRREIIDQVKEAFVAQRFLGRECTFGDDRHLTNLVLLAGYQVVYSRAMAFTEVPTTIGKYLRQQIRWGKSHWREMLWTARALPKHPWYLSYQWLMSLLMPFLLLASVAWSLWHLAAGEPAYAWHLAVALVLMALVRAAPAIALTRDWRFLLLVPYALLHLLVLLPLKFWSLATIARGQWGTRSTAGSPTVTNPAQSPTPTHRSPHLTHR